LIDARNFWIQMKKSLGNKRHKIGDGDAGERNDIGEITRIYGNFTDGETRNLTVDGATKELVVSKIFDNEDFGFRKITVERPLRLAFEITNGKLDALEHGTTAFAKIDKLPAETREHVVEQLRNKAPPGILKSRDAFDDWLKHALPGDQYVTKSLRVQLRDAFSERDETAEICTDSRGKPEPDAELRDTENVPLKEDIHVYFKREVLPHVPDAWIDESKTKIGYEIPLNRHFYRYEPPRALEEIESDIKTLESEILSLLKEVTA
jgi:type I restriction enzyme M protein